MPELRITRRNYTDTETTGVVKGTVGPLTVFSALTLERGWHNNEHGVSCVLPGIYFARWYTSPKNGKVVLLLTNVPGRDAVEVHSASFFTDLRGCVAVGYKLAGDINADGSLDLTESRDAMDDLREALGGYAMVKVIIEGDGREVVKQAA